MLHIIERHHPNGRIVEYDATDDDLIRIAQRTNLGSGDYTEWTLGDAVDCFGEDVPPEMQELFDEGIQVVISYRVGLASQTTYYTPATTPGELEWAKDFLFHDLQSVEIEELAD